RGDLVVPADRAEVADGVAGRDAEARAAIARVLVEARAREARAGARRRRRGADAERQGRLAVRTDGDAEAEGDVRPRVAVIVERGETVLPDPAVRAGNPYVAIGSDAFGDGHELVFLDGVDLGGGGAAT